ncbi:MAG: hypothetical protein OXF88_17735 [Rhodobacteraceae bacterium]|nr:hypothetical protein [Paracoccaceae bacterium]MCY4139135.1 hypothetical protein [Paracoccaceae bacterium]
MSRFRKVIAIAVGIPAITPTRSLSESTRKSGCRDPLDRFSRSWTLLIPRSRRPAAQPGAAQAGKSRFQREICAIPGTWNVHSVGAHPLPLIVLVAATSLLMWSWLLIHVTIGSRVAGAGSVLLRSTD